MAMALTPEQKMEVVKMLLAEKHDTVQGFDHHPMIDNGIFTNPGGRSDMFVSSVQPTNDFLAALPMYASQFKNEADEILTGQDASTGTNPTDVCGTPPVPGDLRKMSIMRPFGRLYYGSEKVTVPDIGKIQDRGVVLRSFVNSPASDDPYIPEPLQARGILNSNASLFNSMKLYQFYKLGTAVRRAIASNDVNGNTTLSNVNAERGWIKEFDGLARLVKSGYTDAVTSTAAPAADSHVVNWNNGSLGTTKTINGRAVNIVQLLDEVYYSRVQLAEQVGAGTSWALVMDRRLFLELARVYAYTFNHQYYAGSSNATETTNRERAEIERRFEDMMNNFYLPLMGQRVPVLFSSGRETSVNTNATLNGDIFLVAMAVNGAPVTYMEYFNLNNQAITEWNAEFNSTSRQPMNNGLYLTAVRSGGFCDEILLTAEMRLVHRTPFLSARVNNVNYQGYTGYRDWEPGATDYYGGGVTSTFNQVWT